MITYPFVKNTEDNYTFVSVDPKGQIIKCVTFEHLGDDIYNVLLASEMNGVRLGGKERSDNGDAFRVLTTVVQIIKYELALHPYRSIYIQGSDNQREMAYQRRAMVGELGLIVLGQLEEEKQFEP